jgi:hypothetical protein
MKSFDMAQIDPHARSERANWKRRVNQMIGLCLLVLFCLFEFLNFNNFCYRDMRKYNENELIDIAIKLNLARFDPQGERNKPYSTIAEFISQNPKCCNVHYSDQAMDVTPIARVLGIREVVVSVYYKMSDIAEKYKYYDSSVKMNSCGEILRTMGTPERIGPTS